MICQRKSKSLVILNDGSTTYFQLGLEEFMWCMSESRSPLSLMTIWNKTKQKTSLSTNRHCVYSRYTEIESWWNDTAKFNLTFQFFEKMAKHQFEVFWNQVMGFYYIFSMIPILQTASNEVFLTIDIKRTTTRSFTVKYIFFLITLFWF